MMSPVDVGVTDCQLFLGILIVKQNGMGHFHSLINNHTTPKLNAEISLLVATPAGAVEVEFAVHSLATSQGLRQQWCCLVDVLDEDDGAVRRVLGVIYIG